MRRVLELPAFRRLLAVSMINEIAFSIGAVALALLVYRRTGSAIGAAGFFLSAEFGPALISPLFVARLDQRVGRRLLATMYLVEAVSFGLLAWIVGHFSLAPVLLLVLIDGSLAVTSRVLVRAAWTSLTTPVGLMREANAVVNTGYSICFMVGPAIGGVIVATGGTRAALLVNVGVFILSALTVATAGGLPTRVTERSPAGGRLRAAIAYARNDRFIRRLLTLQACALLFFTISIPVEVVFAQHTLHAGAGGYGALLAAWGGGAIAGSGLYARWRNLPSRMLISAGAFLLGAGFLVLAIAPDLEVAIAGAAIAGGGNGSQVVSMRTALQEAVEERWMALILSLDQSMFEAVPGAGILLGGGIAAIAGPRAALATAAAGSLVLALVMWVKLAAGTPEPSRGQADSGLEEPAVPAAGSMH